MSFLTVETTEFVFCPSRCGSEETEENSSDGETFTVCLPLISNSKLHYEESTNEDTCRLTGISDSFNQCTCPRQDSSDYYCDSLESEDCFQGGLDSLERICTIGSFLSSQFSRILFTTFVHLLGAGTFGRVVLSRHRISQRFFALKILPIRSVIESQQVDHVHWEKRILERIDHPFIVKLWVNFNLILT